MTTHQYDQLAILVNDKATSLCTISVKQIVFLLAQILTK